jgi:competence protein ComEC
VATLATAPFGSFHFHTINSFGLIGNALAVPLVSVAVMPCAVLGVLAFPFGLDRPAWQLMGVAVVQVLRVRNGSASSADRRFSCSPSEPKRWA